MTLLRIELQNQLFAILNSCCTKDILPYASCIDIHGIRKLDGQGRSSVMYSFYATFSSGDSEQQDKFILRLYKEGHQEKGRKEFALVNVLKEKNIPVPTAYWFEENNAALGKSFMIMEQIAAKDATFYLNDEESAKYIVKKMAKCLAMIHNVELYHIENSDVLGRQCEHRQKWLLEISSFINKRCPRFLGFCPSSQRRFIEAVKRLGHMEPKKVPLRLVHLDYEPNHVLVLNGRCVVVDWGEASVGDPAYDVAWTYHKLRLGREKAKIDLGEYFVNCYEKYCGQKLVNLQFFKDMVAIEMAKWCGLSPFHDNRFTNYRKLLALFFGDVVGEITRSMYVRRLRRLMAGHHTSIWTNINYIQSYALQYLENDRYKTMESAEI